MEVVNKELTSETTLVIKIENGQAVLELTHAGTDGGVTVRAHLSAVSLAEKFCAAILGEIDDMFRQSTSRSGAVMLKGFGLMIIDRIVAQVTAGVVSNLKEYFEAVSEIKAVSNEAASLQSELQGATTDAERIQILRKISSFSDRIERNRVRS